MTAEIFLAVFLASVLVAALQWAFVFTVYRPVQRWLANRAWEKHRSGGPCIVNDCKEPRATDSIVCRSHQEDGFGFYAGPSATVTEMPARSHRIWARRGHAHAGDRLQVFVDIPGIGWKIVFDEPWPLGATNIGCLWNGDFSKLRLAQDGPSVMLEELLQDPRTRGNGSVSMHWADNPSPDSVDIE